MKVNTDGVLLGAWADTDNIRSALDVGTGSGLIALMIAQRSDAIIDAVEIDQSSGLQAVENIDRSPWKNRIMIHQDSFQHFAVVCGKKYDLIISNPPYFRDALKPGDKARSKARHDVDLGFEELLQHSSSLLAPHGKVCVILPYAEKENFIDLAHLNQLYCQRITSVMSAPGASFSRVMMTFGQGIAEQIMKSELVIRQENGQYSPEYIDRTRDFYLAF